MDKSHTLLVEMESGAAALNKVWQFQFALAGVAQWIEHRPVNQRITGSIPSQGTRLGCGPGPQ